MPEDAGVIQVVPPATAMQLPGEGWGDAPIIAPPRNPLERPLAAMRRYKWLIVAVILLSAAGGLVASRLVKPDYEVRATIWIASQTPQDNGPIRSRELLNASAWMELLNSFRIQDAVVRKLALFVQPKDPADSALFNGFELGEGLYSPGVYKMTIEKRTSRWHLQLQDTPLADSGAAGDSIGRKMGFRWRPEAKVVSRFAGSDVEFTVATPRETSIEMRKRLVPRMPLNSNFLWLTYTDPNPHLAAKTLNAWANEYVSVAGELKKDNSVRFVAILESQLKTSETSLRDAEAALENFRVEAITLPAEGGPVAGVSAETRTPAITNYFNQKIELDNLKQDRQALEKVIAARGQLAYESVMLLPSIANSPGGRELDKLFQRLSNDQGQLTLARQTFTDQYPQVRDMAASIEQLKNKTIPGMIAAQLGQIREREQEVERRLASSSVDLQAIPTRTIEEMRLRRAVDVSAHLYGTLKQRHAEAQLAAAGTAPDVNVMDTAVAPLNPTKNTAPRLIAMAIFAGLAAAIGLAIILDSMDKRIRYPEQATKDLGLTIAGTVPLLPKGGVASQTPEQLTQLVESFRTLRMNVMHSSGGNVSLAVSSPSPGDGKSFIASNLAMSFADAGFRTLLVDGDTRRGTLHEMFDLPRAPGLTDYLAGEVDQNEIIKPTGHEKLQLIPSGHARRQSPELLITAKLSGMVEDLRRRFDVVIFDTPPLAAGIDGYAIAAAAGSLLVVLRIGQTERRMAAAKLLLADRLPISVMGTVLNGAPSSGEYEYYGYVGGYSATDEPLERLEPEREVAQIS